MAEQESEIVVEFKANPIQKRFIESRPKIDRTQEADIFNSRLGEGKSTALVMCPLYHTMQMPDVPGGCTWAIVRDTFENLQKSTMKEFFRWFPDGVAGTYHAGKKEWTWGLEGVRGTVIFVGMDDKADAIKVQSIPLAGFCIDEVSPMAGGAGVDRAVFTTLMSRLRQPGCRYYVGKLAQNNPDESHWSYKEFIDPGGPGRNNFQTAEPENLAHLPPTYYDDVARLYVGQQDKLNRFLRGKFGHVQEGMPVTPGWNDSSHLASRLLPIKRTPLHLLWDFGGTPCCIFTQVSPLGHWNILDAFILENAGVVQLIHDLVKPRLIERYPGFYWDHTGDPAGVSKEPSDSRNSAVKAIKDLLGGIWRPGPVTIDARTLPLNAVLGRLLGDGLGVVQVDRDSAKPVWHALRGGWHYDVHHGGVRAPLPKKDIHSHPGDCMGYGAAMLFPQGRPRGTKPERPALQPKVATFFRGHGSVILSKLPKHGDPIETIPTRRLP